MPTQGDESCAHADDIGGVVQKRCGSIPEDQPSSMILIVGGTGRIGRRVASALACQTTVRALARSAAAADTLRELGVDDVVRGDLDDPRSLPRAFAGARRAFLVTPYSSRQRAQELAAISAAQGASLERLVLISSEAVQLAGIPPQTSIDVARSHAAVERGLEQSG